MGYKYELILRGGHVVDPTSNVDLVADVGIKDGQIVGIAESLDDKSAKEVLDVSGNYVLPGIIDIHTHLSDRHCGDLGHRMLARAGVTTTLEIAGPIDSVLRIAHESGVGLNMAALEYVRPEYTVKTDDPKSDELEELIERTLNNGGLGVKMMGGHYPLTPEAINRAIDIAYKSRAYIAFHAGSTKTGSNIKGCIEAIELAAGRPLHLAHINSYCRGHILPCWEETEEAITALIANPNIRSEAYLSSINGTNSSCTDGLPESMVARRCLEIGGFAATEKGMEEAILAGWAQYNIAKGGQVGLITGEEAVAYWRASNTGGTVSFQVNPAEPRLRLAVARRNNGNFVVDCIATDGGGIPRNVIVEKGLALVKLEALTMQDFVRKSSLNPARILGLFNKGHFKLGADADITVVNLDCQQPVMTMVNGKVIMYKGLIHKHDSRIITTAAGEKTIRNQGFEPIVIDIEKTCFYQGLN